MQYENTTRPLREIAADPSADPMRIDPRWQEFLDRLDADQGSLQ